MWECTALFPGLTPLNFLITCSTQNLQSHVFVFACCKWSKTGGLGMRLRLHACHTNLPNLEFSARKGAKSSKSSSLKLQSWHQANYDGFQLSGANHFQRATVQSRGRNTADLIKACVYHLLLIVGVDIASYPALPIQPRPLRAWVWG